MLFTLFLAAPVLHWLTGFPPDVPLAGVEAAVRPPAWGWSAWWAGTLQTEFDSWLNQRMGLRGILVRTANQIQFSLFGELSRRGGTQAVMGKEGFLFEQVYLTAYNQGGKRSSKELKNVSASTRLLQDFLAADGVACVLVIAPSKAEIYPEHLPESADVAGRAARRSNYENLIEHLRRDGVNLLDAHARFLEWKREAGTPLLFAKGGTHWNHYGAARVVACLMDELRKQTGKDLPMIRVTGAVTNRTIVGADNDLGELANLWSGRPLAGPQIHPVLERQEGTHSPTVLMIGDSFVFTLTEVMDREQLYRRRETLYYYNRQFTFPEGGDAPLVKRGLDLLEVVRGCDAVVIEVNEYWLPRIGFGFVRDLLQAYVREQLSRGVTLEELARKHGQDTR